MTSRIRHLEHALAVSQAQLASTNAQSGGYSLGRSGPFESGFNPASLSNVFNPATCTSSVSPSTLPRVIFYLALMLNSVASITMGRSAARRLFLSCQASRKHSALWNGTTKISAGCECAPSPDLSSRQVFINGTLAVTRRSSRAG
jgi:hypothetical protein